MYDPGAIKFEENEIYESSVDVFRVTVLNNDLAKQHNIFGQYDLHINPENITMVREGVSIFVWPYKNIRAYGRSENSFVLEAGRKCQSGPGKFSFSTFKGEGEKIFASVQAQLKEIKSKAPNSLKSSPSTPTRTFLPSGGIGLPRADSNESLPMTLERTVKPRPPVKPPTSAKPKPQPKPDTPIKPTKPVVNSSLYEEVCPEPSAPMPEMSTAEINQIIYKQRQQASAVQCEGDDSSEVYYDSAHSGARQKKVLNYGNIDYGLVQRPGCQDNDDSTYDLVK